MVAQLISTHNLVVRMRPCLRIFARISNRNLGTASCSPTFVQSTYGCRTIRSPFGTFRHRPIFTSAPLSLRYHPPQNPRHARKFLGFLDNIPQDFIFYGIIGINSAVFIMWYMATQKYVSEDHCNCGYRFNWVNFRSNKAIHRLSYG